MRSEDSLVRRVYSVIKKAIFLGYLSPGDRVTETAVAAQLGLSRTPVREALAYLRANGLLETDESGATIVRRLTQEEVKELIHLRKVVETEAISLAVAKITEQQLAVLEESLEAILAAPRAPDPIIAYAEAHRSFHLGIVECSGNRYFRFVISHMMDHIELVWATSRPERGRRLASNEEHQQILAALRARDADLARRTLLAHLEGAEAHMMNVLANRRPQPSWELLAKASGLGRNAGR